MKYRAIAACAALLLVTACQLKSDVPLSEADAAKIADETQAAWVSQDVAKIEARYAQGIVMFDPIAAPLSIDQATFHKLQEGFAAMKFDAITVPDRKIQVLDAEDFIVSGTGTLTSKDGQLKTADMRFTNVYRKQADGRFLIVNEHVSLKPGPMP
jgi:ketosteroid isomerase-like protein